MANFFICIVFLGIAGKVASLDVNSCTADQYGDEVALIQGKLNVHKAGHSTDKGDLLESTVLGDFSFSYPPYAMPLPIFLNLQQQQMWENGDGKEWLQSNATCAQFLQTQSPGKNVVVCNATAPEGRFSDTLIVRKGAALPMSGCEALASGAESENPEPGPDATADLTQWGGDPPWSFQGFLGHGGSAMNLAQNAAIYKKYNVKILTELRVGTLSLNNPVVFSMLNKAGLGDHVVSHCASDHPQPHCVDGTNPTISLGCSKSIFHPQLARKFREMMGVRIKPARSELRGKVVLASRNGDYAITGANNGCRKFVNFEAVKDVMKSIAHEYGLEFDVMDAPERSVNFLTESFGRTVLLVGAHGGALHNHWFMPEGSGLIELTGEAGHQKGTSFWYKVSSSMDQIYAPLYQTAVAHPPDGEGVKEPHGPNDFRNMDISVNTTELSQLMHVVLDAVKDRRTRITADSNEY